MNTPERLSLIGGSILLTSTLVFTLKSQASNILPTVNNVMSSSIKGNQEKQQNQQELNKHRIFEDNYQMAQKSGRQIGNWGSSKYYIDKDNNLHIGKGNLQGRMSKAIGQNTNNNIKTINFDESVQAPQDSSYLFGGYYNSSITSINGLDNLDTSQVITMESMFFNMSKLANLDLSHFDTSNVTNMSNTFYTDSTLIDLNLSNWNMSNISNMSGFANYDSNLKNIQWPNQRNKDVNPSFAYVPNANQIFNDFKDE